MSFVYHRLMAQFFMLLLLSDDSMAETMSLLTLLSSFKPVPESLAATAAWLKLPFYIFGKHKNKKLFCFVDKAHDCTTPQYLGPNQRPYL